MNAFLPGGRKHVFSALLRELGELCVNKTFLSRKARKVRRERNTRAKHRDACGLFVVLMLFHFSSSWTTAQTVKLDPVLSDGSTDLAKQVVAVFDGPAANVKTQKDIEPTAMGFFAWRAMALTRLGIVSKVEGAHLNICRIVIGAYDKEIDATLAGITARATSVTVNVDLTEQEKSAIQKFVVQKISGKYTGLSDILAGKTTETVSPVQKWQFDSAAAMGELAGMITMWYTFPNSERFDANVADGLVRLKKISSEAPAGTDSRLIAALNTLAGMGAERRRFDYPARQKVAEAFRSAVQLLIPVKAAAPVTAQPQPAKTPAPAAAPPQAPKPSATDLVSQGRKLAETGSYKEAVEKYTQAIAADANNGEAFYYRAMAYQQLNMIDQAIEDASAAIRLRFSLSNSFLNRGTFYYQKQNYTAAKKDFDLSIQLDARNRDAVYRRGLSSLKLGELDPAMADFSATIKLDPKYVNAYVRRAEIWCKKKLPIAATVDQQDAIKLGAKITIGCPAN